MRAILIKPDAEEYSQVEVVEYDGDYRSIYDHISYDGHRVSTYTCVDIDERHTMFVDDEGLLHRPEHFMLWRGYDHPLAGRGLILGTDDEGESVACTLTQMWVRRRVLCATAEQLRRVYA